jgi:hypothetical protein
MDKVRRLLPSLFLPSHSLHFLPSAYLVFSSAEQRNHTHTVIRRISDNNNKKTIRKFSPASLPFIFFFFFYLPCDVITCT